MRIKTIIFVLLLSVTAIAQIRIEQVRNLRQELDRLRLYADSLFAIGLDSSGISKALSDSLDAVRAEFYLALGEVKIDVDSVSITYTPEDSAKLQVNIVWLDGRVDSLVQTYGYFNEITYPDANTISFGGDAILLDPSTLIIDSGVLTVIGGGGGGLTQEQVENIIGDSLENLSLPINKLTEVQEYGPAITNGDGIFFQNGVWTIKNVPNMISDSGLIYPTNVVKTGNTFYFRNANNDTLFTATDAVGEPGGGITSVSEDSAPVLGGNLDLGDYSIFNTTPTFTITPTEMSYLDGVTSPIQTQLNSKASTVYVNQTADSLRNEITAYNYIDSSKASGLINDSLRNANLVRANNLIINLNGGILLKDTIPDVANGDVIIVPTYSMSGLRGIHVGQSVVVEGAQARYRFLNNDWYGDLWLLSGLSGDVDWYLPPKSGTIAMLDDITTAINTIPSDSIGITAEEMNTWVDNIRGGTTGQVWKKNSRLSLYRFCQYNLASCHNESMFAGTSTG